MELARMFVVYAHLIACCIAIGLVATSDVRMVKALFDPNHEHDEKHLPNLQRVVLIALTLLWLTGLTIIGLDVSVKGWHYMDNPKLQAKILLVLMLTVNGVVLHNYVLPRLQEVKCCLFSLTPRWRHIAVFTGSISATSWFGAALLGIARPLNWKYSIVEILGVVPFLIVMGYVGMNLIIFLARMKRSMSVD